MTLEATVNLPFLFRRIPKTNLTVTTGYNGAFCLLGEESNIEDLIRNNHERLPKNKINELEAKSLVSTQSEYRLKASLQASSLASQIYRSLAKPSLFMIVPTLRCDHDCKYCQVSRAPINAEGKDLSAKNIDKVLSLIESTSDDDLKIEFQGGEPLLNFKFIKEFISKAKVKLKEKNVSYVICTTLTNLTNEIADFIKDENIQISASIDGDANTHKYNRPSKYYDSYDLLQDKRRLLSEKNLDSHTSYIATVTRPSLGNAQELAEFFFSLSIDSIFIRPLTPLGFASSTVRAIGYTADEYMDFYKQFLKEIIRINIQGTRFVDEMALIHLNRIFRPGSTQYVDMKSPAGLVLGGLIINYDGKVFGSDESRMLWEMTHSKELVIGDITLSSDLDFTYLTKTLKDSFLFALPGCSECAYQPYCGADPIHHLATQGDPIGNKSESFFCNFQTLMYDMIFTMWQNSNDARKVFRSWLKL